VNVGFGVFLTLRPGAMTMHAEHGGAPGTMDHPPTPTAPAVDHSQHAMPKEKASAHAPGGATAPAEHGPGEPRLPVVEAERVIDPACAATIDLVNAPKATYQRKVYYFCSAADRDEFVKDPAAYLKKRGK
jgi:YHS domain-containing protein